MNFPAGHRPNSVAIGDLDGDQVSDLAVANGDSDIVSVLLGLGDGTFAAAENYSAGNGSNSVAIGDVDAADLAALLGNWGPCADCENCPPDFDGDCIVNAADLALLLGNWGACF